MTKMLSIESRGTALCTLRGDGLHIQCNVQIDPRGRTVDQIRAIADMVATAIYHEIGPCQTVVFTSEDVLAKAIGIALESHGVKVDSLQPGELNV